MAEIGIYDVQVKSQQFVSRVYGWMTMGLAVTGFVAAMTLSSPALMSVIFGNRLVFYGLMIVELVFVYKISSSISTLSSGAASGLFLAYAALNGLTLSMIFVIYTSSSIATTFFVSAGMFGCMAVIGATTTIDLTAIGSLCIMGVVGVFLAIVANMFLHNSSLQGIITYAGIALFVGLTAYDAQKIKQMSLMGGDEAGSADGRAVYGALSLYLDFINLFLFTLRLMGRRRS
jgi:uncharacterized protein